VELNNLNIKKVDDTVSVIYIMSEEDGFEFLYELVEDDFETVYSIDLSNSKAIYSVMSIHEVPGTLLQDVRKLIKFLYT
jgi:hypothetical protein